MAVIGNACKGIVCAAGCAQSQTARGIVSSQGASLVNQLYLQEMAPVLHIVVPTDLLAQKDLVGCDGNPTTCHDMVGFHLGHSVMVWKWCASEPQLRPAIFP